MRTHGILLAVAGTALLAGCSGAGKVRKHEVHLSIDQVPEAVKATILREAGGASVDEIERETRFGKTVYEAEWQVDGDEVEIKVAADGTLLKKEVEAESQPR